MMPPQEKPVAGQIGRKPLAALLIVMAMTASITGLARLPLAALPLCALLLVLVVIVWRKPVAVWLVVPAGLAWLDLSPWLGDRLIQEFDLVIFPLLVAAWIPHSKPATSQRRDHWPAAVLAMVSVIFVIGALRPLVPWPGLGLEFLSNPMGPFVGLTLVKGLLWACAMAIVARSHAVARQPVLQWFGDGMVLAAVGVVATVLTERYLFSGIFDFDQSYRVTGSFSAMRTGGAFIEAFLVVALPFAIHRLQEASSGLEWAAHALILGVISFAVMVTFARGGYLALLLVVLIMLWGRLRTSVRHSGSSPAGEAKSRLDIPMYATMAVFIAIPLLGGSFAFKRLSEVIPDAKTRHDHWRQVINSMDSNWQTTFLGEGLGSLPRKLSLRAAPENRTTAFALVEHDGTTRLRLGAGHPVYVEQLIDVAPDQTYQLSVKFKGDRPGAKLGISICEKWIIASAQCASIAPIDAEAGSGWTVADREVKTAVVGAAVGPFTRPVKISLFSLGGSAIDVAQVQLLDPGKRPLIQNPDFSAGMNRWSFTADHHLDWHAKSLPIGVFFELGVLGLAGLMMMMLSAAWHAARLIANGHADAVPWMAAMAAFAIVGMTDTLIDHARFLAIAVLLYHLPTLIAPVGRGLGR